MNLRGEFKSSFKSYVPDEGDDLRRRMLGEVLEETPERIVELMEPHDLAALFTCAVAVDPCAAQTRRLLEEIEQWQQAREDAEGNYNDPNTIKFDPQVDNVPFKFDQQVDGLAAFFQIVKTVENGKVYFAQILACLIWARRIPAMIPNLWKE